VLLLVLAWAGGTQQRDAAGTIFGSSRARLFLRLRGGGDAVRPPAVLKKMASKVDALDPHEAKPDLKRHASRLVLNDGDAANATNATTSRPQEVMGFRIDGREVTQSKSCLQATDEVCILARRSRSRSLARSPRSIAHTLSVDARICRVIKLHVCADLPPYREWRAAENFSR